MIKQSITFFLLTAFFTNVSAQIEVPELSQPASVIQRVGLANVTIHYGRPSLNGRKMLGAESIPFGKIWRTGANEITTIEFSKDMTINSTPIAKGKYALLTIPGADEWTIILNKDDKQWGAYRYKDSLDIMRFKVKAIATPSSTESLTFEFNNIKPSQSTIALRWQNTQVNFDVAHDANAEVLATIKTKASDKSTFTHSDMGIAMEYYCNTNQELAQALEWATILTDVYKRSWVRHYQGTIAFKMGDYKKALEYATIGLAMAEKEKNDPLIVDHKTLIAEINKKLK